MSKRRIRQAFSAAASSYAHAATVQRQVTDALAVFLKQTIQEIRADAGGLRILDVGSGTGFAQPTLGKLFPDANLLSLDISEAMLRQSFATPKICADADALPLANDSIGLLWSSLTWQWCDLPKTLSEARRVLHKNGALVFSTLTEQTYHELRAAFSIARPPEAIPLLPANAVLSAVHDAGFCDIATYQERILAHYPTLKAMITAIRETGTQTTSGPRQRGLLGKANWHAIESAYAQYATPEGLPLTYDVIYVTAKKL